MIENVLKAVYLTGEEKMDSALFLLFIATARQPYIRFLS